MEKDRSWTCPYCSQIATLQDHNINTHLNVFDNKNKIGKAGLWTVVQVCPNSKCKEFTIETHLYKVQRNERGYDQAVGDAILTWKLKPQSSARPFPAYIPEPILEDYKEACLIAGLSPKASATLSRRCLQGIIRDFWKISKARLIDEINALQGQIDLKTWEAIDAVRSIGNIGAHMERKTSI